MQFLNEGLKPDYLVAPLFTCSKAANELHVLINADLGFATGHARHMHGTAPIIKKKPTNHQHRLSGFNPDT